MIAWLADKAAYKMKTLNPDHPASVDVLRYGMHIIFLTVLTVLLSLVPAIILGRGLEVLIALVSFAGLRAISGGFHFKSPVACAVASSVTMLLLSYAHMDKTLTIIVTVLSIILTAIYAPSKIEEQTRIPERYFRHLKVAAVLVVGINFLVLSSVIAAAFAVQSISLIRMLRRR